MTPGVGAQARLARIDSDDLADLATLDLNALENALADPTLTDILGERYASGSPYTFVASVLLYMHRPGPVGMQLAPVRDAYRQAGYVSELPPHLFSLLETSYRPVIAPDTNPNKKKKENALALTQRFPCGRSMQIERESQSVVLMGERGAGKSTLANQAIPRPWLPHPNPNP